MSFLANPPETPIAIDGGIAYSYVIAQQGAIEIAVADDSDFTFALTPGEPAMLQMTFTGTILASIQYKTVTISLTGSSGIVQTHSPQFKILGTSASQRVPNITTIRSRSVAPNQSVAIKLTTDISVTGYAASNLPSGLSMNTATGLITGSAPSIPGFNVITLKATNGIYHYYRYFVLDVGGIGDGSFPSGPFQFP